MGLRQQGLVNGRASDSRIDDDRLSFNEYRQILRHPGRSDFLHLTRAARGKALVLCTHPLKQPGKRTIDG